jgi:hypothetical protein
MKTSLQYKINTASGTASQVSVLTAANMKLTALWNIEQCRFLEAK